MTTGALRQLGEILQMYALTLLGAFIFVPAIGATSNVTTCGLFARFCGIAGMCCAYFRAPETNGRSQERIQRLWMESGK
jgi:hypothetical protein